MRKHELDILKHIFSKEWVHERHYFHKEVYVRFELLKDEYDVLEKFFEENKQRENFER